MWTLVNAEVRNAENPVSFEIHERRERESLEPGMFAKLIFLDGDSELGAERMWVEIGEVKDGRYVGTLANNPFDLEGLRFGDRIDFGPEHIIDIFM